MFSWLPITLPQRDVYSRSLVLESAEKSKFFASLSINILAKFLEGTFGKSCKAKKFRTGDLLIEVSSKQQATNFLNPTRMPDLDIRVTPNDSLNSCRGVIYEPDLMKETDSYLLEGLRDQGVTTVRRVTMRKDNQQIPTKYIIWTLPFQTLRIHKGRFYLLFSKTLQSEPAPLRSNFCKELRK